MQGLERFAERFVGRSLAKLPRTEICPSAEEAVKPTVKLINGAERAIGIVGDLDEINDLRIAQALERASEKGVSIEIVHGPEIDEKSERILQLQREDKVKLHQLDERPMSHSMVVDARHAIVEERHWPGQDTKRYIRHNSVFLGRRLDLEFRELIWRLEEQRGLKQ